MSSRLSRVGFTAAAVVIIATALLWALTPSTVRAQDRASQFAAAHGSVMVQPGELPPTLAEAIIATEDERFYEHHGVDVLGLGRALLADVRARCLCQGGSTLTEQLAKELYLGGSDAGLNKVEDMVLAVKLETHLRKRQILADYLSDVPSGANIYGMQRASCSYFGLALTHLDLAQSALLAGLPQAPSSYDPASHPRAAVRRRSEVLASMVSEGYITATAAATATVEPALERAAVPDPGCPRTDVTRTAFTPVAVGAM